MREAPGEEDYRERVSMSTGWRGPAPATCRELGTAGAQSLEERREGGKTGEREGSGYEGLACQVRSSALLL